MEDVASGLQVWIYRLTQLINEILRMHITCERVYYLRAIVRFLCSISYSFTRDCQDTAGYEAFLETTDR